MLAATLIAACGGGGAGSGHPSAFAWPHPASVPPGWAVAHLRAGGALAYPSSWRRVHSDPGTASAARMDPGSDLIAEYLNATPQQGDETLANWTTFRPAHNREEGDSRVQVLGAARGLRFRNGQGSCVIDRYRTSRTSYQEIACLVRASRGGNVVVAAALASQWTEDAPALERAVSAFLA